ncbi:MAG: ATPase, T2SS/T4P/T4SS family, partial [Verrucomicrobiota bacterium]|nr:ATPase, T2SS/T4P/T4SS family [Verrucomicrobiota bacterium]
MNIDPIFLGLDQEQRSIISALPRGDRLIELATMRNRPTREILSELADLAEIAVIKDIELIDNPTATLPLRMIHEYQCIPIRTEADDNPKEKAPIALATLWPPDEVMSRWVYAVSGRKVQWFMGDPEQITESITQNFGVGAGSLDESDLVTDVSEAEEVEDEDAAVIRFVNEVVQKAVSDRATDIHFEPHRDELQIRYRIDGELVSIRVPDNLIRFQGAIISRLKIMAKLNISEKRRPQDGRISFGAGDSELDIRISTFPTMYGE